MFNARAVVAVLPMPLQIAGSGKLLAALVATVPLYSNTVHICPMPSQVAQVLELLSAPDTRVPFDVDVVNQCLVRLQMSGRFKSLDAAIALVPSDAEVVSVRLMGLEVARDFELFVAQVAGVPDPEVVRVRPVGFQVAGQLELHAAQVAGVPLANNVEHLRLVVPQCALPGAFTRSTVHGISVVQAGHVPRIYRISKRISHGTSVTVPPYPNPDPPRSLLVEAKRQLVGLVRPAIPSIKTYVRAEIVITPQVITPEIISPEVVARPQVVARLEVVARRSPNRYRPSLGLSPDPGPPGNGDALDVPSALGPHLAGPT